MKYRAEIDGLRAVAVVPVILFHAGFGLFSGGFVGVDVFFVISGYLITTILLGEMDQGKFSIVNFYERRARRILPALFVVVAATIPFAWVFLTPSDMRDFAQSLAAVALFSSNILFAMEHGYFDIHAEMKPLLHTWSLAVEEQYYIFFPPLLMLLWRFGKRRILTILSILAVISLVLAHWGAYNAPATSFYLLHTRGWELMIGAFAAFYFNDPNRRQFTHQTNEIVSLIGLGLILFSNFFYDSNTPFPSLYALAPTVGAVLIILCAHQGTIANRILSCKVFVGIGLISYSAYLWHQPMIAIAKHAYNAHPPMWLMAVLCVLVFPLSYLTWRYVEAPFRNKALYNRQQIFVSMGAVSVLVIAVGVVGHVKRGNYFRYDARELAVFVEPGVRGDYAVVRRDQIILQPFDDTPKRVLFIGDSFSGDMINAFYEHGIQDDVSLSSFYIPGDCGNLYVDDDLTQHIAFTELVTCEEVGWYSNETLRERIEEATQVLLVSVWKDWQLPYIEASLGNLRKEFGDKFLVVGTKGFKTNLHALARLSDAEREAATLAPGERVSEVNHALKDKFGPRFFSVMDLFCSAEACRAFTDDVKVISQDGAHLTKAGATYYGKRLSELEPFSDYLK